MGVAKEDTMFSLVVALMWEGILEEVIVDVGGLEVHIVVGLGRGFPGQGGGHPFDLALGVGSHGIVIFDGLHEDGKLV